MSPAEVLRTVAKEAREAADAIDQRRRDKAASVVRAAAGLGALRARIGGSK